MREDQSAPRLWPLIGLALVGIWLGGGLTLAFVKLRSDYKFCKVVMPQVAQAENGDALLMDYRFCGLISHQSGKAIVRLKRQGSSRSTIVFAYTPSEPKEASPHPPLYPDVTWDGEDSVALSISQVLQVHRKLEEADGISIHYEIGEIEFEPN